MQVTLIPLMGPFHLRYALYNAVSVRDAVAAARPEALATTALAPGAFDSSRWQDTPEIALPHTVVPWARRHTIPVYGVLEASPDPAATNDFRRYAAQYPKVRTAFQQADAKLGPLDALLTQALTLKRIFAEVVPVLLEHQTFREEAFGDGPGTDWLRRRAAKMAAAILALPLERIVVLAEVEHLPFLQEILEGKAEVLESSTLESTEETRERSLLDFAFRTDVPEPGPLIAKLRELSAPEARYHEANLLTANGHVLEALDVLETASRGDFSQPYYLPGYLLARLGQLYDLAGRRDAARRAYRGVLALDYAPPEAREAAQAGLAATFTLEPADVPN